MANISNVINVQLLADSQLAARDNLNVCMIITQEVGALSTALRSKSYVDSQSVAEDFGTSSQAYAYALNFFSTSPNPISSGGELKIGFWRAVDENVDASAAILTGGVLNEPQVISTLQQISDGTLDIDIDGTTENLTGMDFQSSTTLEDVISVLNTELSGVATASLDGTRIVITSDITGVLSLITLVTDPGTGTFVGEIIELSAGTGASTVQGAAASVLPLETKLAAITALKSETSFFGAMFIDAPDDSAEVDTLATWAQANGTLIYDVFASASNLVADVTNPVWKVKISSQTYYRCLFSAAGNRKMAASYMARVHVVNFNAENSAITMNLKTLSVAAEAYSQSDINAADKVGLDIYTTIKQVGVVLSSGANGYVDNQYNLLGYVNAVEVDTFNLLKQTQTKIAQTTQDVNAIVGVIEGTTRGFTRANVFAPGEWSSPDTFGDLTTFESNIRQFGFYVLAGLLADQPQVDRQARKSPVIQVAVKNAGAIHSVDIIINFNI